jgi:tetratricopeptide (TPR) repeat protein
LAAILIGVVMAAGCASAPATAPPVRLDFPAPDTGPGRPDLSRADHDAINDGWRALLKGDPATARASAAKSPSNAASELLSLQASLVAKDNDVVPKLQRMTKDHSEYAAAWLTLSVAAESSSDEAVALEAATRGAELWPERRWRNREQSLYRRYVGERVATARDLYQAEKADAALKALEPALAIDPNNRDAVLLKARALVTLDQPDRAEAVLSTLPRDPEVVRLAGSIAEARGDLSAAMRIYSSLPDDPESVLRAAAIAERLDDWATAMNLYDSLPNTQPEKGPGLRRAKLRWRISVMPDYVREAIRSPELDRAQLAVVLVGLAPKVETLPGGQVPLLSDIMNLPSQNEILTVARLGLIDSDHFLHRYHPDRLATASEVRSAVNGLARLLGFDSPHWCATEEDDQPCTAIVEPITGESVARIVIDVVSQEGDDE